MRPPLALEKGTASAAVIGFLPAVTGLAKGTTFADDGLAAATIGFSNFFSATFFITGCFFTGTLEETVFLMTCLTDLTTSFFKLFVFVATAGFLGRAFGAFLTTVFLALFLLTIGFVDADFFAFFLRR